jgi:hypothetical protein
MIKTETIVDEQGIRWIRTTTPISKEADHKFKKHLEGVNSFKYNHRSFDDMQKQVKLWEEMQKAKKGNLTVV